MCKPGDLPPRPPCCSSSYLVANLGDEATPPAAAPCDYALRYSHAVMRVRVPYTFDVSADASADGGDGATFDAYDTRYFSVGTHACRNASSAPLPFWTVNARMMATFLGKSARDAAGDDFFIFFAPQEQVVLRGARAPRRHQAEIVAVARHRASFRSSPS